jgi:hypothetical protein
VLTELFADQPQTTITSGGTDAPAAGTTETLTPASGGGFPAVSAASSMVTTDGSTYSAVPGI